MSALSIPDQLREMANSANSDFDAKRLLAIADEVQRLQVADAALVAIYGKCGEETWPMVASGEVVPPWPLPAILAAQGLGVGRHWCNEFLIWSEEHRRWWKPGSRGYTDLVAEAGRYGRDATEQIVRDANYGSTFNEIAIPVPAGLDALIERTRAANQHPQGKGESE